MSVITLLESIILCVCAPSIPYLFLILLTLVLATYGYAKQYSGVNLSSFTKHITSSNLTKEGLRNVSGAVMQLAKVEELEAHRRAVSIRLDFINETKQ